MKKILTLFTLLFPLFASAQGWFTADAVSVGTDDETGELMKDYCG